MTDDTHTGDGGLFPPTRWSAIEAARSADRDERQRALDRIVSIYWKPIYKYLRARHRLGTADAQDLTQEFFTGLIDAVPGEPGPLERYDPQRGRLRSFLRHCVDGLVANTRRDAQRLKRGGGSAIRSLDFELAEGELSRTGLPSPETLDSFFEREWIRSFFAAAVERFRSDCAVRGQSLLFELLRRYDLDPADPRPTYRELAEQLDLAVHDVTNRLAAARREFRRGTLELLRETCASDDEFRREARSLLGHGPP